MTTIFRAHAITDKFQFEAYAADEDAALASLRNGLEVHGRAFDLPDGWWENHYDIEVEGFEVGRGYRDGSALDGDPGLGGVAGPRTVARASMDTGKFRFEAYGRNRTAARSALLQTLRAHGKACGLPLDWWRGHFDLDLDEYEIGTAYRDHHALPAADPAPSSGPR